MTTSSSTSKSGSSDSIQILIITLSTVFGVAILSAVALMIFFCVRAKRQGGRHNHPSMIEDGPSPWRVFRASRNRFQSSQERALMVPPDIPAPDISDHPAYRAERGENPFERKSPCPEWTTSWRPDGKYSPQPSPVQSPTIDLEHRRSRRNRLVKKSIMQARYQANLQYSAPEADGLTIPPDSFRESLISDEIIHSTEPLMSISKEKAAPAIPPKNPHRPKRMRLAQSDRDSISNYSGHSIGSIEPTTPPAPLLIERNADQSPDETDLGSPESRSNIFQSPPPYFSRGLTHGRAISMSHLTQEYIDEIQHPYIGQAF
ncbi:MAG: hypothetical protein M1834_001869 [Cirrosporium novae-zelandiae]|nr:MAG: hypothetical protein M1834_001869 [Cirrosporium novae-zelandiae]